LITSTEQTKETNITKENLELEIVNKRESVDMKLNERELIGQRQGNPYFSGSTYLDDLKIQDDFLIPKNSNCKYK